jgi:ABC-type transport system substrate-binding protein
MQRLVLALPIAALLLLSGCQKGNFSERTQDSQKSGQKVLTYAIFSNPTTIDPHTVQDGDTIDVLQNVFEGLVGWGTNNEPVGLLAEKWDVSPDGKVYTFHLRKGVKFHNGKPLTADDVKWSVERACTPAVTSTTADEYMNDIQGVHEMVDGKAKEVSGVKVVDTGTVEITLVKPVPYFLGKLTYLVSAVVPKGDLPLTKLTDIKQAIGTGPFKIKSFDPEQEIVLQANADYWGGKPKLDEIVRPVVKDGPTRLNKFRNGEIDLLYLQRADVSAISKDAKLKDEVKPYDRPATYYVSLNQKVYEPFKKKEVRQAFAMAIDRKKIVGEFMEGLVTQADSIVPPGIHGGARKDAKYLPYDPKKALEMLKAAGYPDPSKMPPLTINFRSGQPDVQLVGESVATQITQNLGVPVSAQPMDWTAYLEKFNKGQLAFYHMRWAADFLDPQNFLSNMLATGSPENHHGFSNAQFDQLCTKADGMMDMDARLPLYAQAEDIALQEVGWIPIYYQKDYELISPRVTGLRDSIFGHLPHTTTDVK